MRAVGLTRVSTTEQAISGLGVAAQEAAITEYAKTLGYELTTIHHDTVSGGAPLEVRPGLLRALDMLDSETILVVSRRDRLGRDVVLNALVTRLAVSRGSRVVSACGEASDVEGPTGDLVRTILDAIAQYEKALIGLRTASAMRAKLARNEPVGRAPFGFRYENKRLVPDKDEQKVIELARQLQTEGKSLRDIVLDLHGQGVVGRKRNPLGLAQVHRLLRRSA